MNNVQLTKTKMAQGVWQGIITGFGEDRPKIEVTHEQTVVDDIILTHNQSADHWTLSVRIPDQAIADGIQTLLIRDAESDTLLGNITVLAGDPLGEDIRAEVDLLRAELDMLKRAFRRHCAETS